MKLLACLGLLVACASCSLAQTRPVGDNGVMRIYVMHADPWAVKALIEGTPISQPELSTILGFAGIPSKESSFIESIFGGQGTLVVNPTDNSILFFPKKG
jgi:hypothetical protein